MSKERQEQIGRCLKHLSKPWVNNDLTPPEFSVLEISRRSELSPDAVINTVKRQRITIDSNRNDSRYLLSLVDRSGKRVTNPKKSAIENAPYKRSVKRAKYRSRAPGGGPVIKRRINKKDLLLKRRQLGKGRLKVKLVPFDDGERKEQRRKKIREKLALRWQVKSERAKEIFSPELQVVQAQARLLEEMGLWATSELKGKYGYRLSPDVLELEKGQKEELEEINQLLFAEGGILTGTLALFKDTSDPRLSGDPEFGIVRKAFRTGISKKDLRLLDDAKLQAPFIARLDLILSQDKSQTKPSLQIVEMEGDKTHALGYVTIADYFRERFLGRMDTPGVIDSLRNCLLNRNIDPRNSLFLIVGEGEKFYLKELEIFSNFSQKQGINLITIPEGEVVTDSNGVGQINNKTKTTTLVNIPPINQQSHQRSHQLTQRLMNMWTDNQIQVLIPPQRFLGSKGLLGLISNGGNDPKLEAILEQYFNPKILHEIRKFLPKTILVTKRNREFVKKLFSDNPGSYVIKEVMSSGMRGVALPGDEVKLNQFFERSLKRPFNYVVQQKVSQQVKRFRFVEPGDLATLNEADMFMRISLFAAKSGVATVGVTARKTPDVHGARDAIQIPVVFK